jgi:hypothetical protein
VRLAEKDGCPREKNSVIAPYLPALSTLALVEDNLQRPLSFIFPVHGAIPYTSRPGGGVRI